VAADETLSKFGISLSAGCAEFDPSRMASVNDVLRAADADMYEAKARRHEEIGAGGR
jgi:GGDEF domain-containing protein